VQRERSPQEGGQEGEGVEEREKEYDMDLEEEREDSSLMLGKIGNPAEETLQKKRMRPPRSKKTTPKPVVPTLNHPYPKCILYKW
jgi:hypothetical protein